MKEKLERLIGRIVQKKDPLWKEDIESVENLIHTCGAYVDAVIRSQVSSLFGEQSKHASLDVVYDELVNAVKNVNDICCAYNVEPIFQGDLNNRKAVESFAKEVVDDMFRSRKL